MFKKILVLISLIISYSNITAAQSKHIILDNPLLGTLIGITTQTYLVYTCVPKITDYAVKKSWITKKTQKRFHTYCVCRELVHIPIACGWVWLANQLCTFDHSLIGSRFGGSFFITFLTSPEILLGTYVYKYLKKV